MKKHELLTESLKRFPNHTKVKSEISGEFKSQLPYWIDGTGSVSDKNGKCLYEKDRNKWAELVESKKEPLLVSEDGVELFEGDKYYPVWIKSDNIATEFSENVLDKTRDCILCPEKNKAFKYEDNALQFVNDYNKPKEIEVKLFNNKTAIVKSDLIEIKHNGTLYAQIYPSDIEDISHALKQLSC